MKERRVVNISNLYEQIFFRLKNSWISKNKSLSFNKTINLSDIYYGNFKQLKFDEKL